MWKRVFEALRGPDLEWMVVDSTVARAHQQAAGEAGGKGQGDAALGRSRGGSGTQTHSLVDAPGNPAEFIMTVGQEAAVSQAGPSIAGHKAGAFILD